ncbi:MAG: bifunctional 3-(3-hydroxy-phenyl)propionate/3-hydroxycinnamic acid hydroxylase [Acidimicrobiales bacterium]
MTARPDPEHFDVVIVGYGPVGQVLASLLGRKGHRVAVFERFHDLYPLPRAVRLDGEVMRLLQNLQVIDDIDHELVAVGNYLWFGADGEVILDIEIPPVHPSGWADSYLFHQPTLERALDRRARREPTVTVLQGWAVEHIAQVGAGDDGPVQLSARRVVPAGPGRVEPTDETTTVSAPFVIGADGANSIVRNSAGISCTDFGFEESWLVVDFKPNDMNDFAHLPLASQRCDPARPVTVTGCGATQRRWEFMLVEGETAGDLEDTQRVWELLRGHASPDQGELVRHAVYVFRSIVADTLRSGRMLVAGDAAHLMPPFMGEGMCSGIRDAANLAWKLDLVLSGTAPIELLDTYTSERLPQNMATIAMSVEMGKVSCVRDREAAAGRDAAFRSGAVPPPPPLPLLHAGVIRRATDVESDPLAGSKAVQGVIRDGSVEGRTDDVMGPGFSLMLGEGADPAAVLSSYQFELLGRLGVRIVVLDPSIPDGVHDVDGALTAWMAAVGVVAVIIRPDHYVFGSARTLDVLPALVDELGVLIGVDPLQV